MSEETEARYGTRNTKLAAALLVLGFSLRKQPFTSAMNTSDPGRGYITTIWFQPVAKIGDEDKKFPNGTAAIAIAADWMSPKPSRDYVLWMRKALETRDYLIKQVIRAKQTPSQKIDSSWISTDVLKIAAAIIPGGYALQGYRDRRFYFEQRAQAAINEYHAEVKPLERATQIQWGKLAILQQDLLVMEIKGPKNHKQIIVENGPTQLVMGAQCPEEVRRAHLYRMHNLPQRRIK